eukprot:72136-Pyramimonas_sp.AAC.1
MVDKHVVYRYEHRAAMVHRCRAQAQYNEMSVCPISGRPKWARKYWGSLSAPPRPASIRGRRSPAQQRPLLVWGNISRWA